MLSGRCCELVRHRLAIGEREHAILAEPSRELGTPAAGTVFVRDDDADAARSLRHERGVEVRPAAGDRLAEHEGTPRIERLRDGTERRGLACERGDACETRGARRATRLQHSLSPG
ncbi:MAG: hypothetical protein AUH85_02675 [Chloroflexi bacterium 13_1_40CM_4_68_4]|nr:MAG: hypothetical protein AUH85_02675 [Chloroflexi bacterium 13_1_40CM_4_68_4]